MLLKFNCSQEKQEFEIITIECSFLLCMFLGIHGTNDLNKQPCSIEIVRYNRWTHIRSASS